MPDPNQPLITLKTAARKRRGAREPDMRAEREVSLFKNGANQALRIPKEFELPGDRALLRKEGDLLVVSPIRHQTLAHLLDSWEPLEPKDEFPEIDELPGRPVRF